MTEAGGLTVQVVAESPTQHLVPIDLDSVQARQGRPVPDTHRIAVQQADSAIGV
jgi:hypothetical protein